MADTSDHKPWNWDDEQRFRTTDDSQSTCHAMNARMGTHITCQIDHASFDAHLANELKKPRISERDPSHPSTYCGELAWYFFSGQETMSNYPDPRECPACGDEFKRRVKTLSCAYREGDDEPTASLQGTTLTIIQTPKQKSGTSMWLGTPLRKIFKSFDAYLTEHS